MKDLAEAGVTRIVMPGGDFYNGIEWFACWLLDHAEGETITEEQLRQWGVEAWNEHIKKPNAKAVGEEPKR